jgi:diguanylate cyclase (GGDEF)-like protein/PAS domain S-box-containing protein
VEIPHLYQGIPKRQFLKLQWLLIAGISVLLIGVAGIRLTEDSGWVLFFDNLHWTAGTTSAALLAWLSLRSATPESRKGLRWIAIGLTGYAIGQIIWNVQTYLHFSHFPSPSDLFYLSLGPCLAIGLIVESFRLASRVQRKSLLLDAAIFTIASLVMILVLYMPGRGDISLLSLAVLVAYPASLFAAACIAIIAIPTLHLRPSWSYLLFLASLIITALCWMAWNLMALNSTTTSGTWFNSLFSFSILAMGAATLYWNMEASSNTAWERLSEGFLRMMPLATVILACFAALLSHTGKTVHETIHTIIDTGVFTVIILAAIRQSALLREHVLLKAVTKQLEESEQQKNLILDTLPDLIWLKDVNGVYQMCNPVFERFFGAPESEIIGKTDFDFVDNELARFFRQQDQQTIANGQTCKNEEWVTFADDGHRALLETLKTPLCNKKGEVVGVLGIARDITQRANATRQLALVDFALNHVTEAAYLADEQGYFHYVNTEACNKMGYERDELLKLRVIDVDNDHSTPEQWRETWEQFKVQQTATFESTHKTRDGKIYPVEINANYFEFGGRPYILGLVRDISERKEAEEQIRSLAFYDPLTQLPNRRMLIDRLRHALVASKRSQEFGALLILDLDHFKSINDTLGHDAGDRLLIEAGQRILANVRQEDTVSRLGGDEFVVMLEQLGSDEVQAASHAELIAEKIRDALTLPYCLNGNDTKSYSTTSIGVTLFRAQESPLETLLKQADVALYQAKDAGRNAVRFFNPSMQATIETRMSLETALRRALEENEFRLYYQPQFDHKGGLIGAEALIRWLSPGKGEIPPAQFIPLAEETGLILPIGQWVLETACAQLKAWEQNPRTADLQLSVNVSARQFHQQEFVDSVHHCLNNSGISPARLKLELTESVVLDNVDEVVKRMQQLDALGVQFSLDDFGTGYSSLSYLKRLPLEQLKIDRSFVHDVTDDPNDAAIVQAIVAMSGSLGLQAIAEGVETEAQRDFLYQSGCTAYQGFLFGKPMPIDEWHTFLR